jgi:sugar O-acyltransferase (sialic acid O-acetyltransferase NeuD family)
MSKDKAIIFGLNDFAATLLYQLKKDGINQPKIYGFTVNKEHLPDQPLYCGLPVVAFEELKIRFSPLDFGVFVCIGFKRMNESRQKVFELIKNFNYDILSFVHPSAQVETTDIGIGTIALQNVIIGEYCSIGDGNIFHAGSMLAHHGRIGNYNYLAVNACVSGRVSIGNFCFFGANSTVKDGITIGDKTLVGANAYVDKDTEPLSVIVPAKSCALLGKTSLDFF